MNINYNDDFKIENKVFFNCFCIKIYEELILLKIIIFLC